MRFCNSSLASLSLVGCRAVTSLELKCPRIEQICLDGCDHLETAFFQPVSVTFLISNNQHILTDGFLASSFLL